MQRYPFQCALCGETHIVQRSIAVGPPDSSPCDCGGVATRVWTAPEGHTPNAFIEFTHPQPSLAAGARSNQEQERLYGRIIESNRKVRAEKKRVLSRRQEGKFDGVEIPREMYNARMRQFGKDYWRHEGKNALKRDGLI